MEATSGDNMRRSAGCRYIAGISLYSAHTGNVAGPTATTVHAIGANTLDPITSSINARPFVLYTAYCHSILARTRRLRTYSRKLGTTPPSNTLYDMTKATKRKRRQTNLDR